MKMKTFIISAFLAMAGITNAAVTLTAVSFTNGVSDSSGSGLAANSIIRYGFFANDAAVTSNIGNIAALETAFVEVASQVNAGNSGFPGFFQHDLSINDAASFESVNYNTGIVGKNIYAWVSNNTNPASATEYGIFRTNELWQDAGNPNMSFTLQTDAAGFNPLIGSTTGPVLFAGNPASIQLATIAAIPEPSRAMLGLIGRGALVFRRRR
jgi:hypothetical protein